MLRHGKPPFMECSSKGDKRFSAFYAVIQKAGNRSIEELYQSAKLFEDGRTNLSWKEAKGKKAINQEECNEYYSALWTYYILIENPFLLTLLQSSSGLSDMFGQPKHCCQATELWRIRNLVTTEERKAAINEAIACIKRVTSKGRVVNA